MSVFTRKMTYFKVVHAHQNRMNFRSRHQCLFLCYCWRPRFCSLATWWIHADSHTRLIQGALEIRHTAYITWWVNGSLIVGRASCKRVCRQEEISCPKNFMCTCLMAYFIHLSPLSENAFAFRKLLPVHRGTVSLSQQKRHRKVSAGDAKHSALPYGTPEARWTLSCTHTHTYTRQPIQ